VRAAPLVDSLAWSDPAKRTYLKSLSLGVFEYINKPVEKNDLVRIVKAALEQLEADNSLPAS
jgi:DNA-binding NtrC family response regulator